MRKVMRDEHRVCAEQVAAPRPKWFQFVGNLVGIVGNLVGKILLAPASVTDSIVGAIR
jgi:hypothetical protein